MKIRCSYKNKDVCFPTDSLICSHSPTIGSQIATPFNSPSSNPQVFDPAAQTSLSNQTESEDAGETEEDVLRNDNFLVFLPHDTQN